MFFKLKVVNFETKLNIFFNIFWKSKFW